MQKLTFTAGAVLALFASPATAQIQFDYITFDRIQLDPDFALQTSTRWGILVNTGTEPISLNDDWERGLWYAESSEPLGAFFYELLNPFGNDFILQPGEAIGDNDPLLLAELLPGETFTTAALITTFQFGVPFPEDDFQIGFYAQIGEHVARTRTVVEITDLGGSAFWTPVSARRVSCELSPVSYESYGSACSGPSGSPEMYPRGHNGGPGGPPWVAFRSSMPQLGNWAFALEIQSPVFSPDFLLGLDLAPTSLPVGGCELLLALTPALTLLPGTIPFFQETANVPIPPDPTLAGLDVYFQALVLSTPPISTNGVRVTLGDVTN